jgi:protein-tyrosine phosphatase
MQMKQNGIGKTRILMVCLGNICRSPLAEGVMKNLIWLRNIEHLVEVDSAGTSGLHAGAQPDARSMKLATMNGFNLNHSCRQLVHKDFETFDHILVMDMSNYENVLKLARTEEDRLKVKLISEYDGRFQDPRNVPDPYYGTLKDFERVYEQLVYCCEGWLEIYFGPDEEAKMSG